MTRDLLFVIASLFLWGIGEGSFLVFQTLYLEEWGASALQIGAVLSGWAFMMAIAQIPAGYLADRRGPRLLMWATWILGTLAAGLMAAAGSLGVFIAGLLLYGLTSAAMAPMNSYITAVRGRASPERALTLASAAFSLGMTIGPGLGGLLAGRYNLRMIYIFASVLFFFSTLFILAIRRPPKEDHSAHPDAQPLTTNRPFMILVGLTLLTTFAMYLPQPLTPNYLTDLRGLSLSQIGLLGTLGSLGTVLLSLALGGLKGSVGYLLGQPLVGLFALLVWRGQSFLAIGAGYLMLGGYRLTRVTALSIGRRMIHPEQIGLAYGMLETANAAAIILAPLLAGALYERTPAWIYILTLILIGAGLISNWLFVSGKSMAFLTGKPARQPTLE